MKGTLTLLGTGGSLGVPIIGCDCSVCLSSNPKNRRLRSANLLAFRGKNLLIDAGPDFRLQALRFGIRRLDGLIVTHGHYDHTAGLDDLRAYFFHSRGPLPLLLSEETYRELQARFGYLFKGSKALNVLPKFEVCLLPKKRGALSFLGQEVRYMTFEQPGCSVNGFRFGDLAYLSDIKTYPESLFEDLEGVKTLILSALRYTSSELHFTVDEALDFSRRAGSEKTWLTHLSHDLDEEKTNAYLPENVRLAYDGLTVEWNSTL